MHYTIRIVHFYLIIFVHLYVIIYKRSHRKDNERFYATHKFYSFEDFSKQLQRYNYRDYNRFPMRPLGWKSPQTVLDDFVLDGVTYV